MNLTKSYEAVALFAAASRNRAERAIHPSCRIASALRRRRIRYYAGRLLDADQHDRRYVNGVKLVWEECETEYNASKGVEHERLKKRSWRQHRRALVHRHCVWIVRSVAQDKIPLTTRIRPGELADGRVYDSCLPRPTGTRWRR